MGGHDVAGREVSARDSGDLERVDVAVREVELRAVAGIEARRRAGADPREGEEPGCRSRIGLARRQVLVLLRRHLPIHSPAGASLMKFRCCLNLLSR